MSDAPSRAAQAQPVGGAAAGGRRTRLLHACLAPAAHQGGRAGDPTAPPTARVCAPRASLPPRRHKHIGRAVCAKAEELGAEPLVVSAHEKSALERLLMGSVSSYCAAHSKRPVLLLHPNHSQL